MMQKTRKTLAAWAALMTAGTLTALGGESPRFVLTEHGIPSDDGVVRTAEIQALIDRAAAAGGGTVVVPPGTFVTGGLHFRKGTHLHLEKGSVLKASRDISDYALEKTRLRGVTLTYFCAVVNAINADGFTLTGEGTVDGDGFKAWRARWLRRRWNPDATGLDEQRPRLLFVSGSNDVRIEGVTFLNPPFWTTHYYDCRRLKIVNVTTKTEIAPDGTKGPAVDGMDLDGVEDVLIKDCHIDNNDDGIVFKGGYGAWADDPTRFPDNRPNSNILIEGCTFGSQCHACVGCGSECYYVSNVIVRNCRVMPGAWNVVRFKIRPDTPQRYEDFRIEHLRGSAGNFIQIDTFPRNHAYYEFGDRKDIPKSMVANVRTKDVKMRCRRKLHTWFDPAYPNTVETRGIHLDGVSIDASPGWVPLENPKDVMSGSALDLSGMGFRNGPAGRQGWLKVTVDGHFAFEKDPSRRVRFNGINLCGGACFPDKALADEAVVRLSRFGWDSVRLHHYDRSMTQRKGDGTALDPKAMESFDYFFARLKSAGFHMTMDLYDSRPVTWEQLGIADPPAKPLSPNGFKCLVPFIDAAFENWCSFVRNFLCHVNPYTGLRYVDDPALPLLVLINENRLAMGDWWMARGRPEVQKTYADWLADKRARGVWFPPDAVISPETFARETFYSTNNAVLALFMADTEADLVRRQKAFLKSIGVKALLSGNDCGPWFAAMQPVRETAYDFVDAHWYGGKPRFLSGKWKTPCAIEMRLPADLFEDLSTTFTEVPWVRVRGRPFTCTEWNFAGSWPHRSVGGLTAGACAALQGWDGLWQFAYAQGLGTLAKGNGVPDQYNVCADPVMRLGAYATALLFRRGDMAPAAETVASSTGISPLPPNGAAKALSPAPTSGRSSLWPTCVSTLRTAGGFLPSDGMFSAGPLGVETSGGGSSTIWASALDGDRSLAEARRIVLFHVTDVRGSGYSFRDGRTGILSNYGCMPLKAREGDARVRLDIANPEKFNVWALDLSGRRMERVPSRVVEGRLTFLASVAGPPARFVYEIERDIN